MEWDTIRFEKDGQVGFLILDRPASLNAVNEQMILDLAEAAKAIEADTDVRVLVIKGEGRAFCSGMDLRAAVLYGAPPDAGPTYRLPRLIGLAKAKEIVILGERFDAAQAERWGLLTKIVEPENLAAETTKLVERCLKVGWKAAAATKHLLSQAGTLDSEALAVEIDRARAASIETGEFTESMQIYREKRKPQV